MKKNSTNLSNSDRFSETRTIQKELDAVSPTFCTAKWLQSTILLYNGETHSCHHPARHKIPVESLKDNPSGIHNTPIKIFARKELLNGIQTKECEYCWRIENLQIENLSDRALKSAAPWARPYLPNVIDSKVGETFEPTYLEIAFESTCNFACSYCTPEVSTRWMEDIESHGPYLLENNRKFHDLTWIKEVGKYPIHRDAPNPYTDAFWAWWPTLYPKLEVFRLTGGEPLLSKHTWRIFDEIENHPNKNLEFAINTNLGVPKKLIEKLVENAKRIIPFVKEFKIFTSIEATGKQAEYIRYGLNYDEFMDNLNFILSELPSVRVVIMTTIGALSTFTFRQLLEQIIRLRATHVQDTAFCRLGFSVNYLRWPEFMDLRLVNKELLQFHLNSILELARFHKEKQPGFGEAMFYIEEIDQLERLKEYALQPIQNREELLKNFHSFFRQYDERRGLSFESTFPPVE
jgi:organic radical activating enzyme